MGRQAAPQEGSAETGASRAARGTSRLGLGNARATPGQQGSSTGLTSRTSDKANLVPSSRNRIVALVQTIANTCDYFTPKEVAQTLGLHVSVVYRAVERGELPAVRLMPRGAIKIPR